MTDISRDEAPRDDQGRFATPDDTAAATRALTDALFAPKASTVAFVEALQQTTSPARPDEPRSPVQHQRPGRRFAWSVHS